jgi:hypothetical protein
MNYECCLASPIFNCVIIYQNPYKIPGPALLLQAERQE